MNVWDEVLERLRTRLDTEEFRRWFGETFYASDAGDQVTVWVPSQSAARHISSHYQFLIDSVLADLERPDVHVRFLATGGDDEEDEEHE